MSNLKRPLSFHSTALMAVCATLLFIGCQSGKDHPTAAAGDKTATAPAAASPPAPVIAPVPVVKPMPAPAPAAAPAPAVIRINAGATAPWTDSSGNVWLADTGFADGETIERGADVKVENTKDPALYRTERYSMTAFAYPLPNGKYKVRLHFAETFEGVTAPGERVFSFTVEGHEFKDFDVFVKAGGVGRAYIETVPVEITDGKLDITFKSQEQNPEINGLEIFPGG